MITGVFTSSDHQLDAISAGFELLSEIVYTNWIIDYKVVFDDPGIRNDSAKYMHKLIVSEDESDDHQNTENSLA